MFKKASLAPSVYSVLSPNDCRIRVLFVSLRCVKRLQDRRNVRVQQWRFGC